MVGTEEKLQNLKRPLQQFTPKTITRLADLRQNVAEANETGIATAFDEYDEGVSGVSAPIIGSDGKVHCTLGITLPTARAAGESFEACKKIVREQADLFSAQLGYTPR